MVDSLTALIVRVTYTGGDPPRDIYLEANEYARIGTNRTINVMCRGWGGSMGDEGVDREIMEIEQSARNSLLPCNAEETGETQEWEAIQLKLYRYGIEVTIEDLKNAPVVVEIEPRLRRMVDDFTQPSPYRRPFRP